MLLQVEVGGYVGASVALADGNRLAALVHDALVGRLSGSAGMAGDDSSATEFVAAYDEAAAEGVAALGDLVDSCAGLARLSEASAANHRAAEMGSIIGGASVYEGGTLPPDGHVTVLPVRLPSSLGGDPAGLPGELTWLFDHLEGFVWPDADTGRLREAAGAWRSAGQGLEGLAGHCESAIAGLGRQRSPEIPIALAAADGLRETLRDLVEQYAALAAACDEYADLVEEHRRQVLELARWLLAQVVEGIVISVAIGALTAGAGTAAGLAAVVARVAAESPRFARVVAALRVLAGATAGSVRVTGGLLRSSRLRLAKYVKARDARLGEAGTLGRPRRVDMSEPGWLGRHEHSGSHTLARHVGRSEAQMLAR